MTSRAFAKLGGYSRMLLECHERCGGAFTRNCRAKRRVHIMKTKATKIRFAPYDNATIHGLWCYRCHKECPRCVPAQAPVVVDRRSGDRMVHKRAAARALGGRVVIETTSDDDDVPPPMTRDEVLAALRSGAESGNELGKMMRRSFMPGPSYSTLRLDGRHRRNG
ncbi:MAG: hypothetical protein ACHREM_08920 [Polyangiales bacterium]